MTGGNRRGPCYARFSRNGYRHAQWRSLKPKLEPSKWTVGSAVLCLLGVRRIGAFLLPYGAGQVPVGDERRRSHQQRACREQEQQPIRTGNRKQVGEGPASGGVQVNSGCSGPPGVLR